MTTHPEREELMAWRDGEVPEARALEIGTHVEDCHECRGFIDALASVSARLATWTPDATSPTAAPVAPTATPAAPTSRAGTVRRTVLWAAAAVLLIGIASTVRVECAPAPTCDLRTMHLAFLPTHTHVANTASDTQARSGAMTPQQAFERDWLSRRRLPVKGGTAKVTVVMFLDWQCPACRAAERAYGVVFADFERRVPGAVQVVIKDYPLNKRCNPNVPVEMHPAACEAAVAVRLAREHGTAPALIEWLFVNQESLTPASVTAAAAAVGKIPNFAARYNAVLRDVAVDINEAKGLEVGGTPTCFINGVLARNNGGTSLFSPDEIRQAIEVELRRVR